MGKESISRGAAKFFEWVSECCKELGWPIEKGKFLVEDPSWFFCYDDGMTPKEAVKECLSKLGSDERLLDNSGTV